ncbi:hypothetical protein [Streptomyces sp. NPDC001820]|uniref:hypothetical protein n=1 Tax=Streptomyces sp. NPDC001820 TaxID=3364613 RepID=UPI0036CF626B
MANTTSKRRQRSSIRSHGDGFQVRVYAGLNPLTKEEIRLTEQAETWPKAEKIRTRLLNQVDEHRHPKTQAAMVFLLDRWLGVAELDETSYERAERIIRNYLKPTFGGLKAGKLTAEMLELFYARLLPVPRAVRRPAQRQGSPQDEAEARLRAARGELRPQNSLHPAARAQPRSALGLRDGERRGPRRAAVPASAEPGPSHPGGGRSRAQRGLAAESGLGCLLVHRTPRRTSAADRPST